MHTLEHNRLKRKYRDIVTEVVEEIVEQDYYIMKMF